MAIGSVLIVSRHPLFAESLKRLIQAGGGTVIACVPSLKQALSRPSGKAAGAEEPTTVIVDYEAAHGPGRKWLALLEGRTGLRRVILLTLDRDEMIVHEQRRLSYVTEKELLLALRGESLTP